MERPGVGVGVFVIKDGKILMQRRRNAHGDGTWSLPGGHLEMNEAIEECARREAMEELGVSISDPQTIAFTNDIFEREGKHYVTIFVSSVHADGEPQIMEPDKCDTFAWFSWDEMPRPIFLPLENLIKGGFRPVW